MLGGGQLGRMFAMAARRLGYRVHTLAPEDDTPTAQVADVAVNAPYDDLDAVRRFARGVDVVTFEFENVSAAAAAAAEACAVVRPSGHALQIAQHRVREKTFLADHGLPVTPFASVQSEAELQAALERIGCPSVLKTSTLGYDGKGQMPIVAAGGAMAAWDALGRQPAILEAFIDLDCEISVIGARGVAGEWSCFGPIENAHRRHILDVSVAPAAGGACGCGRRRRSDTQRHGGARVRRDPVRGVLRGPRRPPADQRAGAASAQLGPLDVRRLPHESIRAAGTRRVRPAARISRAAAAGGHGQPAWRSLGAGRAGLGRRAHDSGREASPLRKGHAQARPKDGPPHGSRANARWCEGARAAGTRRAWGGTQARPSQVFRPALLASRATSSLASRSNHGGWPASAFSVIRSGRDVAGIATWQRGSLRIHLIRACAHVRTPNGASGSSADAGGERLVKAPSANGRITTTPRPRSAASGRMSRSTSRSSGL